MSFMDKINIWNDTVKRCNSFQFRPLKSIKYNFQEVKYEKKYKQTNIEILNKDSQIYEFFDFEKIKFSSGLI